MAIATYGRPYGLGASWWFTFMNTYWVFIFVFNSSKAHFASSSVIDGILWNDIMISSLVVKENNTCATQVTIGSLTHCGGMIWMQTVHPEDRPPEQWEIVWMLIHYVRHIAWTCTNHTLSQTQGMNFKLRICTTRKILAVGYIWSKCICSITFSLKGR